MKNYEVFKALQQQYDTLLESRAANEGVLERIVTPTAEDLAEYNNIFDRVKDISEKIKLTNNENAGAVIIEGKFGELKRSEWIDFATYNDQAKQQVRLNRIDFPYKYRPPKIGLDLSIWDGNYNHCVIAKNIFEFRRSHWDGQAWLEMNLDDGSFVRVNRGNDEWNCVVDILDRIETTAELYPSPLTSYPVFPSRWTSGNRDYQDGAKNWQTDNSITN